MKKVIIFSVLGIVLLGAGGAASYFLLAGDSSEVAAEDAMVEEVMEPADPIYMELGKPLVINFTHLGKLRYLQASFELMHTDQDVIDEVKLKIPVIRNNLIMLLSDQSYDTLNTQLAKEQLREKVAGSINELIGADPSVEIYITSFLMQ